MLHGLIGKIIQEMIGKIEYQAQEITEKIGQLKALQVEMERKEQLYEECSRQLQVTPDQSRNSSNTPTQISDDL